MTNNIVWHDQSVSKLERSEHKNQKPCVLWFTGLSGSGKSTVANALEHELAKRGQHTFLLDGDNVRHGLNKDLGFSDDDRVENIRRIGEVSKLFVDAGLIAVTAFISPFRSDRQLVRDLLAETEFVEIHMNTPLATCESRDPKGLYKKARAGEIKNFTGIDSDYEAPLKAEITLDSSEQSVEECVEQIIGFLTSQEILVNTFAAKAKKTYGL